MQTSLPAQVHVRNPSSTTISSYFASGADDTFYLFGVSIVAPLLTFYSIRVIYVFAVRDRARLRPLADRCPSCDYTLEPHDEIKCPECGMHSSPQDRTRQPAWKLALRDRAWLRRFTLAVLVGVISGPALCTLESVFAISCARRAFTLPLPTTFTPAPDSDWDPPLSSGRLTYVDVFGGRLFFNHWDDSDIVNERTFRVARFLPWRHVAQKYVKPDYYVFSYY